VGWGYKVGSAEEVDVRPAQRSQLLCDDPLYWARRTLHTGADLLTDKQAARLTALFAIDEHVEVEATWASTSG
jgi:hypothetical protein